MARLFADENYPRAVVLLLRDLGHDVVAVQDRGLAGIEDDELFEIAIRESRAVITENRKHFFRLHRTVTEHFGIIATTADMDRAGVAARIHAALNANPDMTSKVIRIYRPNVPQIRSSSRQKEKAKVITNTDAPSA